MGQENVFGQLIRQRRRALDLTQDELARRVGCAAVTLRKIEAGDLRPSQQIAERLAMALGLPLDDRADFVRLARAAYPGGRPPDPTPTPQVAPDEIGAEDLSGRAIRGYLLGEKLGAGSFGAVYRGVQPLVERDVAVKIILPQYANHPDFIRRFEAEAQLVARLEHPHIVPLYDYWREPGVAYLVMRLLRGGSIHDLINRGPLPFEQINRLLEQMCAALHAAHRAGVIHRDLKPSNVLLDEDTNAYLADFGIAKNLGSPDDATQSGMIVGSPAYISPEQINSDPVRPQTDVYALGVMLYEMLTGSRPFSGPTPILLIQQHLYAPMPPLAAHREGLPAALDAVIAKATAKDVSERYEEVDRVLRDFQAALNGGRVAISTLPIDPRRPLELINPYKGLRPFEEADAADFFGREALTQQLLARLSEGGDLARFLAIVGPSGSGKSSVVGAGLLPALRRGGLPNSENWFIVEVLPGSHPLEEIESALLRIAVNPPESLLPQIKEDARGLLRAIHRSLPQDEHTELVLVLDQFEEVFTLVEDESERALLLDALVAAVLAERSRVRVIITLRADFIDKPLRYVDFAEMLQRRLELVLPLTADEIERAIAGPAARVGLQLESGLVEAITADVSEQPGGLPLLQYALTELYEHRQEYALTKSAYQAIGGVKGALGRRAEEVYAALDADAQSLAKQIFLRLVTLGEGVEDTRRRVARTELEALTDDDRRKTGDTTAVNRRSSTVSLVLDAFGKARLLSFDRDLQTRGPTVEVAHEALLREWSRLRDWLIDSRADVRLQRALSAGANDWLHATREASFLLRGPRLQQFEDWAKTTTLALTSDERTYLEASLNEREQQRLAEEQRRAREVKLEQRAKRVLQGLVAVAIIAAIISGALALLATNREQEAQSQKQIAETQKQEALRQASIGLAAQALSELQGTSPERAVLIALEALENYPYTGQAENALARAVAESKPYVDMIATYNEGRFSGVSWSPDGTRLAAGTNDIGGPVFIWDTDVTNAQSARLPLTTEPANYCVVKHVAWSPKQDRLAIVSVSQPPGMAQCTKPTLWDMKTLTATLTLTNLITEATSIEWSHDGQRLMTTDISGTVRIWDASGGTELRVLTGHTAVVEDAVWSPVDDRVASGSQDKTARIWDAHTGQQLFVLAGHAGTVTSVAWSPDGKYLATASADGNGRVWDAATGEVAFGLAGHTAAVLDVAYSSDGELIATTSLDGSTRIWEATNGTQMYQLSGVASQWAALAWSPIGRRLITTGGVIPRVWDLSETAVRLPTHADAAIDARWSPDQKYIADTSFDRTAHILDARTGQVLRVLQHPDIIQYFAWSPDSKHIVTAGGDGVSRIWDVEAGKMLVGKQSPKDNWSVAEGWSPDGTRIASNYYPNSTIDVWNPATGETLLTIPEMGCVQHSPTWSPQSDRFSSGCLFTDPRDDNQPVHIWSATTGQLLMTLDSHDGESIRTRWSPDGKRLAVSYENGIMKVWDATTGQELTTFAGHAGWGWDVVWSPNGQRIASSDDLGNIKVWDAASGEEVLSLKSANAVISLDWSSDGHWLLVSGFFNRPFIIRVWQSTDELIQYAKQCCVARELTAAERQQFGLAAK
ncbi:MAG: protein kinase [Thermoflexales bacterium]|nr:protein kinase [Thermoflexales bacterium]